MDKTQKLITPQFAQFIRATLEDLTRIAEHVDRLQDPKLQHEKELADITGSLDRLALRCARQATLRDQEDPKEVNPLIKITVINVVGQIKAAGRDLELRAHAPIQWEEFSKTLAEAVKTAKSAQQILSQPGASHATIQPGEPLRSSDGQALV